MSQHIQLLSTNCPWDAKQVSNSRLPLETQGARSHTWHNFGPGPSPACKSLPLLSETILLRVLLTTESPTRLQIIFFFFFLNFRFRNAPAAYGRSQARGLNQSCGCRPMPQPQQYRIRAAPATYTTAHGKARSLSH